MPCTSLAALEGFTHRTTVVHVLPRPGGTCAQGRDNTKGPFVNNGAYKCIIIIIFLTGTAERKKFS